MGEARLRIGGRIPPAYIGEMIAREDRLYAYSRSVTSDGRYKAALEGRRIIARELEIHPSAQCQSRSRLNAARADSGSRPDGPQSIIDVGSMMSIIRQILDLAGLEFPIEERIRGVKFSGSIGEPLCAPSTLAAIAALEGSSLLCGLSSNGGLATPDTWSRLLTLAYIHFSMDSASSRTTDCLKGIDFQRVCANLSGLTNERARRGARTRIIASFAIQPENAAEIESAARLYKSLGADGIRYRFDPSSGASPAAEQRAALEKAKAEESAAFSVSVIDGERRLRCADRPFDCRASQLYATIDARCFLVPCNRLAERYDRPLADLRKVPLREALLSERRRRLVGVLPNPRYCAACSSLNYSANVLLEHLFENLEVVGPVIGVDATAAAKTGELLAADELEAGEGQ
jgi:MoaA/NifB/PqqE/SkfB family radical SAM enzyme